MKRNPVFILKIAYKKPPVWRFCASTEIRTPVLALKGLRPGPLDDGGVNERNSTIAWKFGQGNPLKDRKLLYS